MDNIKLIPYGCHRRTDRHTHTKDTFHNHVDTVSCTWAFGWWNSDAFTIL